MPAAQATVAPPDSATDTAKKPAAPRRATSRAAASTGPVKLEINPIEVEYLQIRIQGTAPLIVSRFSEKAKAQMLAAQQGKKKQPEKRNPRKEYLASLYRAGVDQHDNVLFGLPAMAFKMATIGAGRYYGKAVKMTELRQFLFFFGVQVPTEAGRMVVLDSPGPRMREDYVRLAGVNHPADLRYRGCFYQWAADLYVSYTKNLLDMAAVVNLIEAGGTGVGVGEWRPERNGEFGTFRVAPGRGMVKVLKELPPALSPDAVDYEVYGDPDEFSMEDFAELDQAELLTEEEIAERARAEADGEANPPAEGGPAGPVGGPVDLGDEAGDATDKTDGGAS
jgi:hypothetical protein